MNAAYDIEPAWQDSALEEGALCVGRGRGRGDKAAVLRQVHGALLVVVHARALRGRAVGGREVGGGDGHRAVGVVPHRAAGLAGRVAIEERARDVH